jgi:peroxiredoxin
MIESKSFLSAKQALPLILMGLGIIMIATAAFLTWRDISPPKSDFTAALMKVNYPAPELTLSDMQGNPHSLMDYRGKVVLINLWATWCIPCTKEMPTLQVFYNDYKENGFVVIAINDGESATDVLQFVKNYDLSFPVWLDPTYQATERAFKTMNLPSSFVIDGKGTVRWMWVGGISREKLEKYITPLIKNS